MNNMTEDTLVQQTTADYQHRSVPECFSFALNERPPNNAKE